MSNDLPAGRQANDGINYFKEDKNMPKYVRKLNKLGKYSYCVTLPMEFIKKLRWQVKQKVVLSLKGKKIVVEDWQRD